MSLLRSQKGASLMETLVTVGILGLIAYFVVGLLKTGTMGQKQLQAQDDARVVTENMATVLADDIACENTLAGLNPAVTTTVPQVKNASNTVVYETSPNKFYGNRTLKLISVKVGGPATETDAKTGIKKWAPVGSPTPTSGTVFVQVEWEQTGAANKETSGPNRMTRFFIVKVTELNTVTPPTIKKCAAQAASATSGFWSLHQTSGNIYNTNGAGGVGIGTSSPQGMLHVFAGSTTSLMVNNTGRVGVGTFDPQSLLHVSGLSTDANVIFEKNGKKLTFDPNVSGTGQSQILLAPGTGLQLKAETGGLTLLSNGNVGISQDTPAYALHVNGDVQAANFISTSDARLKSHVSDIDGLPAILRLRGVSFRWKKDGSPALGLIAQEVEKVLPEVVATDPVSGLKAIKYESLLAPVIEAVKKLYGMCREALASSAENSRRIAELEKRLEEQAKELAELRARAEGKGKGE